MHRLAPKHAPSLPISRRIPPLPAHHPPDSLYRPIERAPRKFNPLKVPKSLQAALPFKTKPKVEGKRKRKTLEQKRAVVLEPEERKKVSLISQVRRALSLDWMGASCMGVALRWGLQALSTFWWRGPMLPGAFTDPPVPPPPPRSSTPSATKRRRRGGSSASGRRWHTPRRWRRRRSGARRTTSEGELLPGPVCLGRTPIGCWLAGSVGGWPPATLRGAATPAGPAPERHPATVAAARSCRWLSILTGQLLQGGAQEAAGGEGTGGAAGGQEAAARLTTAAAVTAWAAFEWGDRPICTVHPPE